MKVRQGQYNFLQLYDWSKSLTKIFDIDGVYSFDIDEAQNRLRIGVQDEGVRQPLEKRLLELGIPLEAAPPPSSSAPSTTCSPSSATS